MTNREKNRTNKCNKFYSSVPGGMLAIFIGLFGIAFYTALFIRCFIEKSLMPSLVAALFIISCVWYVIYFSRQSIAYIRFYSDHLECYVPFQSIIKLEYNMCIVGMSFSSSTSKKVFWIYFQDQNEQKTCLSQHPPKKINEERCRNGFVRIMYREDLYNTIIDLLPKRHRVALETSKRCYIEYKK